MGFPITNYYDNMIALENGQVWAYYRVSSEHVAYIDTHKKEESKHKITGLLQSLKNYQFVDIKMIPRDMTIIERFEQLSHSYLPSAKAVASEYARKTIEYFSQSMGQVYVYDWLIGVPITTAQEQYNVIQSVKMQFNRLSKQTMSMFGYHVVLLDNWYEAFLDEEKKAYQKFLSFGVERLTREEMVYLSRLNYIRGMTHSIAVEQSYSERDNIMDTLIDDVSHTSLLKLISYEDEPVYMCTLPLSQTEFNLANNHFLEFAQTLPFPVEIHYQLSFESMSGFDGMKGKTSKQEKKIDNVVQEMFESGSKLFQKFNEARVGISNLKSKLDREEPILKWKCYAVLYDKDKDTLLRHRELFKRYASRVGYHFSLAQFNQFYLFERLFFGSTLEQASDWLQYTTTDTFSESLLLTNQRIGNRSGFYIGRVDSRISRSKSRESAIANSKNVVLFSPTVANKGVDGAMSDSPHISITGETGKGKSYLMKLLFLYSTFISKTLYFDPKREIKKWFSKVMADEDMIRQYPLLIDHLRSFNYVTLDSTNQDSKGILDPIVFIKDDSVKDIAEDIFRLIHDFSEKPDVEVIFLSILNDVITQRQDNKQVGMYTVVERMLLSENDDVVQTAKLLDMRIKNSILELIFSSGEVSGLDLQANTTVLEVFGLELPNSKISLSDYSLSEKKSLCVMLVVGKFLEKFGSQNPNEDTVAFIDEVWQLLTTSIGKKIFKSMKRTGRSYNNILCYGTQSVFDVSDEEDHGNFGTLFAFDEPKERQAIIEHLNLSVNDDTIEWLSNTIKGQCLMIDMYRRVGKVTVHNPFKEFDVLFKTVEKTNISDLETAFV